MTVLDIQRRLSSLGFNPGPLDGIRGRRTIAAAKAFQRSAGLVPDGIVGPLTLAALFPAAKAEPLVRPPWYEEALRKVGLHEVVNPYWARNWLKFGEPVDMVLGAVCVFSRGSGGHVGFVAGHDTTYLHVLGGNQSNRVSIAKLAKSRLLGLRWPSTGGNSGPALPRTSLNTTISTNEA
jgi:peptidoglycan hydrolase-like protein with peptidoglycan-binding domain